MNQTSAPAAKSLITENVPAGWEQLEDIVTTILAECGMSAQRGVTLRLPRGSVDVDVYAEETIEGIVHRTICECKQWRTNVPKSVVHSFRTVIGETGANRGYIISTSGFQAGAVEAAAATNIELVTFEEFQRTYFAKWIGKQIWAVEEELTRTRASRLRLLQFLRPQLIL
jgi:restriction endonuclease Mrr